MSLKNTVDKIRNLEAEKTSLLAEVENLKRMADAKATTLADEIAALREQVFSLKTLMEQDKPAPSAEEIKTKNLAALREIAEDTLHASSQLGNRVFASSPFSQYYDDWLASLKTLVADFESNSPVTVDEQFVDDRSRIFLEVESALTEKKAQEGEIGVFAKALAENDHLLFDAEKEYAENVRTLGLKRDSEVARMTKRIQELEREVQSQDEENSKRKILKKKTDDKLPQARVDLKAARNQLEAAQRNFAADQDTLKENYEKKRQEIAAEVERLRGQLGKLESDGSVEARQAACKALANSVNAMIQRASMKA